MIILFRSVFVLFWLHLSLITWAQNLESIIDSKIFDLEPLSNGGWAAAIRKLPLKSHEYDTIGIRLLDSTGITRKQIFINPLIQGSEFKIEPIIVLPDSSFLFIYTSWKCDATNSDYVVEKIDTSGQSLWHLFLYFNPDNILLAPDGNLLIGIRDSIFKISSLSGETIWKSDFPDFPSDIIGSFFFVPGTEDVLTGSAEGIKYYQQLITGNSISYEHVRSYDQFKDLYFFSILGSDQNGTFWGLDITHHSRDLYRFRADLQPTLVLEDIGYIKEIKFSPGLFALSFIFDESDVRLYDTLGQLISTWQPSAPGLTVNQIGMNHHGLALGGDYVSGMTADLYPDTLAYWGRQQGWFRYYPGNKLTDAETSYSLSITEVIQLEEPAYDSTLIFGPEGNYYVIDISGGRFQLNIRNSGTEIISSFDVNTMFNFFGEYGFCTYSEPSFLHFENYEILPGDSVWVEFSDLYGSTYLKPLEYCFWTSAPNSKPDNMPGDDMYCSGTIVKTIESEASSFFCFPNPATSLVNITYPTQLTSSVLWNLVDVYGRKIKTVQTENNSDHLTIEIANIPSGMYFINSGDFSKTVVIQH
ncbi:MAG: T9SS type A sorting domain-containing protein [Saprospiraceae bacterium]